MCYFTSPTLRFPHALYSGAVSKRDAHPAPDSAPDPLAPLDAVDAWSPVHHMSSPIEELAMMNTGEDEPSSSLNGRLRPRKSNAPSPQSKAVRKTDGKLVPEKAKRTSTPSKVTPSNPDDLTNKSDASPAPQFLCPYCDRKFANKQAVSKHARRVHFSFSKRDSPMGCLFCNHTEADANIIIAHMVDSHPNQYFACLECHARFPSTSDLAGHKLTLCEKPKPYRTKLRQKSSSAQKKSEKKLNLTRQEDFSGVADKYQESRGFNGIVISCELKPSQVHDGADIEDNITTNLILPPSKSLGTGAVIEKNAVIVLDDIQWNKRIPPNFSFHNTDADQILSRLGVVHRSPRTADSSRRDWLKIDESTQKFEKCFDTSFYSKVASNVQENLSKFLDGSFNFNPDPDHTIKTRKSKNSVVINTAEGFPILLASEQYSRNTLDGYLPRGISPKHKWKWDALDTDKAIIDAEQIKRDSHTNNCIITLVSRLDIWTQLCMRKKFESKFHCAPLEKKTEKRNTIGKELKEILESREIPASSSTSLSLSSSLSSSSSLLSSLSSSSSSTQVARFSGRNKEQGRDGAFLSLLGLAPAAGAGAGAVTRGGLSPPAVLSGEWVRPRCYVCCACGSQARDCRALAAHMAAHHPNAQVQHYEIVGEPLLNADISKHLYVPPSQVYARTRPLRGFRDCTKCKKSISLEDLHQHMLECAGDTPAVRRKCRYRPFGVRKRRPRLPDNTIRKKIRKDIRNRHRRKNHMRPRPKTRTEVGDAETIRKMIADLPAKRHRVLVNPMLRSGRKHDKQRTKLLLKRRSSDDPKSRKNNSRKEMKIPVATSDSTSKEDTDNGSNKDDEDNLPLKPRVKRLPTVRVRQNETIKRKTVLNRAKRKVQMKYSKPSKTQDSDLASTGAEAGASDNQHQNLSGNNQNPEGMDVNGQQGNGEQGDRGGADDRPEQPHGARDNDHPNNNFAPMANAPLKHSIASLTANSETHDKSVQFHHLFLVQQECNNTTQNNPAPQPLFENEAGASKLDKPPLLSNGKELSSSENNSKNKSNKSRKGLSYCIAMLKSKLVEPTSSVTGPNQISVQCGNDEPLDPDPRFYVQGPQIDCKTDSKPAEVFSRSVIPDVALELAHHKSDVPPEVPPESMPLPEPPVVKEIAVTEEIPLIKSPKMKEKSSGKRKKSPTVSQDTLIKPKQTPVKRQSSRLRSTAKTESVPQQNLFDLPLQLEIIAQKTAGKGSRGKRESQAKASDKGKKQDRGKRNESAKRSINYSEPKLPQNTRQQRNVTESRGADPTLLNQYRPVTVEQGMLHPEHRSPNLEHHSPSEEHRKYAEYRAHSEHRHATEHKQSPDPTAAYRSARQLQSVIDQISWAEHHAEQMALEYRPSIHSIPISEHMPIAERTSYGDRAMSLERRRLSDHRTTDQRSLGDQGSLEFRLRSNKESYLDQRLYSQYLDQMSFNEQLYYKEQNILAEEKTRRDKKRVTRRSYSKKAPAEQRNYPEQYMEPVAVIDSSQSNKRTLTDQRSFIGVRSYDEQRLLEGTSSLLESRMYNDQRLMKEQMQFIDYGSVGHTSSLTGHDTSAEYKTKDPRCDPRMFESALNEYEMNNPIHDHNHSNTLNEQTPLKEQIPLNRTRASTDSRSPNQYMLTNDQSYSAVQHVVQQNSLNDHETYGENTEIDKTMNHNEQRSDNHVFAEQTISNDTNLNKEKSFVTERQTYIEQNALPETYTESQYARQEHSNIYNENNVSHQGQHKNQHEQELGSKLPNEMYSDNEYIGMPSEIPPAHAGTNIVQPISSAPLDLSGKTMALECSENPSEHDNSLLMTDYDSWTLDLSSKSSDQQRYDKDGTVNDAVVDLRIKSSMTNSYQENTVDLPSVNESDNDNITELSYNQCGDDYVPTDLSMRRSSIHDCLERRIEEVVYDVQDLSSHKAMSIEDKEISNPILMDDNNVDEPTDLSGKKVIQLTEAPEIYVAPDVPESKEICVSIDLTEDDDITTIAKIEKEQKDETAEIVKTSAEVPRVIFSETRSNEEKTIPLVVSPNIIDEIVLPEPNYDPTLNIPQYKLRATASDADLNSTTVNTVTHSPRALITTSAQSTLLQKTETSTIIPITEASTIQSALFIDTSSKAQNILPDRLPYSFAEPPSNVTVPSVVRTLPVYTLPNPVLSTIINKHESTTPVYTLANACITVTKIDTSSAVTLTNTLLSIAGSTIANTTSVYTLAGTTIGAPSNYGVMPNKVSPIARHIMNPAKISNETLLGIDKHTTVDREPNLAENTKASITDQDLETQRKIAMLPKELVEILGTMPADHRNQLLNVLPQYVSTTTVASMTQSEICNMTYTSSQMSSFNEMPSPTKATKLKPSISRVPSPELQNNPMNMMPLSYRYQSTPQSSGSYDLDSKHSIPYILPPPPPPPPLPPPLPLILPPTSPIIKKLTCADKIKPPFPYLSNITKEEIPDIITIDDDKQSVGALNETNDKQININTVGDEEVENKIIDLTEEDAVPVSRELMQLAEDLTMTTVLPQEIINYTAIVKTNKQKMFSDKTSSLRAVRIKTQSEKNKTISTETQIFSKTPVETETQVFTKAGMEPETQIITKTTIESEIQIVTKTIMEPQPAPADLGDEVKKLSESKKSLAIQQAEISSTQHGNKNVVTECKFPLITSPKEIEISTDASNSNSRSLSTPTGGIVVIKKDKDLVQSENSTTKTGIVTSSISVNDRSIKGTNDTHINESISFPSGSNTPHENSPNVNIDEKILSSNNSCASKRNSITRKDSNSEVEDEKPLNKLKIIDERVSEEEDSDDNISLAVIVQQKQRVLQKLTEQVEVTELVSLCSTDSKNREYNTDKNESTTNDLPKCDQIDTAVGNLDKSFINDTKIVPTEGKESLVNNHLEKHSQDSKQLNKNTTKTDEIHESPNLVEHIRLQNVNDTNDMNTIEDSKANCKIIIDTLNPSDNDVTDVSDNKLMNPLQDNKTIDVVNKELSPQVTSGVLTQQSKKKKKNSNNNCKNNETKAGCNKRESDSNVTDLGTQQYSQNKMATTNINVETKSDKTPFNVPIGSTFDSTPDSGKNAKRTVRTAIIKKEPDVTTTKLTKDVKLSSETEENVSIPLRRSRRGKSMFVESALSENESLSSCENLVEQKTPLTKKQLIFSKLLLDEENNTCPQVQSTPENDSICIEGRNSINTNSISDDTSNDAQSINNTDVEINKPFKRKQSSQNKRKFKKKKSTENIDNESDKTDMINMINDSESKTLSDSCYIDVRLIPLPEAKQPCVKPSHTIIYDVEMVEKNDTSMNQSVEETDNLQPQKSTQENIATEKRKLLSTASESDQSPKLKKTKIGIKKYPDTVKQKRLEENDNDSRIKQSEPQTLTSEIRKTCYMPASRRTRSKSVVVKSAVEKYDPYDIDLDDMIGDTELFRRKNTSKKLKTVSMPHTSTGTHTGNKSQKLSKSSIDNEVFPSQSYKGYMSDSDDSSKSDVPLKKYVEDKERKILASTDVTSDALTEDDADLDTAEYSYRNQRVKERRSRRTLVAFNTLETSNAAKETDEQLRSEQFMESFGFFSERKPRKSNLLASKKISETFHIIANDSDDMYIGYKERATKRSLQNENRKSVNADTRSHQQHSSSKRAARRVRKKKSYVKPLPSHCDICKKEFRRPDNYLRHQMTLLHISKLSEIEMKVKTVPVLEEPNYLIVYKQQLDRLKILTDKLARKKKNSRSAAKIKLPTLDEILAKVHKTVREQQLSQRGLSRDEALFLDCCELLKSNKNDVSTSDTTTLLGEPSKYSSAPENTVKEFDLLDKPTKGDGDVDSITAKNILESEEVRNLENDLISGLKEAANASMRKSKISYQRSVSDVGLTEDIKLSYSSPNEYYAREKCFADETVSKVKKQPEIKEKMYPDITESIDMFEDKFDKIKRKCRSQAAQAKQPQTLTEAGTSRKGRKRSDKKKVKKSAKKSHQSTQVLTKGALKGFDGIKVSIPTSDINMSAIVQTIENSAKKRKKNSSKKRKETKESDSNEKYIDGEIHDKASSTPQKKVDVYEFMDNEDAELFEFRPSTLMERFKSMNHKETPSTSKIHQASTELEDTSDSVSDGDDFVYMSDDYVCSDDETESSRLSCEFSTKPPADVKKNTPPPKKKESIEKNAVMGKIFKHNAVRSDKKSVKSKESVKPTADLDQLFDSLLEDEPSSSMLRNDPPSPKSEFAAAKKYNRTPSSIDDFSSPSKFSTSSPKRRSISSSQEYEDTSAIECEPSTSRKFDKLIFKKHESKALSPKRHESTSNKIPDSASFKRYTSTVVRRRDSSSLVKSDDEVSCKSLDAKRKPWKEKSPLSKLDEGISTSYDLSAEMYEQSSTGDDTGVARQRARRKCAVGKQNVLAETWSSESEPDGGPPRPNSAESVVLGAVRKRKGKRKDGQQSGVRRGKRDGGGGEQADASRAGPPGASGSGGGGGGPRPRARAPAWPAGADEPEHVQQHGWIVGDSHKKLVTMLAHAKGRKRTNDDKRHLLE